MNSGIIVSRVAPRPPQQQTSRVPASRLPRDYRLYDAKLVSGRFHNDNATVRQPNHATIQAEVKAVHWTSGFAGNGNRPRTFRDPRTKNDTRVPLPVSNSCRNITQRVGSKEYVNLHGPVGRQVSAATRGISHVIARPGARSRAKPEVEISNVPRGGATTAAKEADRADVGVLGNDDSSTSRSSRDSARTPSVTCDDVIATRPPSARTSGVFSRMSTEAQQAWIELRQTRKSAEPDEPAVATTSGLDGERRRRRGARHHSTPRETAYDTFDAPADDAAPYRVVQRVRRVPDARPFGNFRITSATYDSRFEELALAASSQAPHKCVTGVEAEEDDDDDNDLDVEADVRAESISKCLHWLSRQHHHTPVD